MAYRIHISGDKHQEDPDNPVEYSADERREHENFALTKAREFIADLNGAKAGVGSATFDGDHNPGVDLLAE
jgi:hypothetical protein